MTSVTFIRHIIKYGNSEVIKEEKGYRVTKNTNSNIFGFKILVTGNPVIEERLRM